MSKLQWIQENIAIIPSIIIIITSSFVMSGNGPTIKNVATTQPHNFRAEITKKKNWNWSEKALLPVNYNRLYITTQTRIFFRLQKSTVLFYLDNSQYCSTSLVSFTMKTFSFTSSFFPLESFHAKSTTVTNRRTETTTFFLVRQKRFLVFACGARYRKVKKKKTVILFHEHENIVNC